MNPTCDNPLTICILQMTELMLIPNSARGQIGRYVQHLSGPDPWRRQSTGSNQGRSTEEFSTLRPNYCLHRNPTPGQRESLMLTIVGGAMPAPESLVDNGVASAVASQGWPREWIEGTGISMSVYQPKETFRENASWSRDIPGLPGTSLDIPRHP